MAKCSIKKKKRNYLSNLVTKIIEQWFGCTLVRHLYCVLLDMSSAALPEL